MGPGPRDAATGPRCPGVDLLSLSAHKLYGLKGIGALVLREGIAIEPLHVGRRPEAGPGRHPAHRLIVGFAFAARLALEGQDQRNSRLQSLRDQLWRACNNASLACC